MIGKGLKYRIEIDDADAELLQIRQFFADPVEVAAEKVVVKYLSAAVHAKIRRIRPILMQYFSFADGNIPVFIKAVGKDLIHHAAFEPVGRAVFGGTNG